MDITCLDHHSRLIDMALTRLGFVLNINPIEGTLLTAGDLFSLQLIMLVTHTTTKFRKAT